jgi:hypothetical protein
MLVKQLLPQLGCFSGLQKKEGAPLLQVVDTSLPDSVSKETLHHN